MYNAIIQNENINWNLKYFLQFVDHVIELFKYCQKYILKLSNDDNT